MSQRYFLVCGSCENRIPVETSQAGRTISCVHCKSPIKLGTMREIRALEPVSAKPDEVAVQTAVHWSPVRRGVFVVGFFLLVICGLLGANTLWKASKISSDRPAIRANEEFLNRVAAFSPTAMLANWEKLDVSNIQVWVEDKYLIDRKQARILEIWGWGLVIFAALGAVAIALAFLMGNPSKQSPGNARPRGN